MFHPSTRKFLSLNEARGDRKIIDEGTIMGNGRKMLFPVLLILFAVLAVPFTSRALETENFTVRDFTGQLSDDRILQLTAVAEEQLKKILDFWAVDSGVTRLGKIRLEFEKPRAGTYGTVFLMVKEGNAKVRVVRVFGVTEEPQMVAHKLTHAVFPSPDKLVRNMMGIPMEVRFGNPLTFPMCRFSHDEWVTVFRRNKSYIPLSKLGPDHEEWGMTTRQGVPVVLDKAKQHIMYAESGSFGDFLLSTYGMNKVKRFYKLSAGDKRPWEEVFGSSFVELETKWSQALDKGPQPEEKNIALLLKMINDDPGKACSEAQQLGAKTRPGLSLDSPQKPAGRRKFK
jgi:hypothetical protein